MAGLRDNFDVNVANPNIGNMVDEAAALGMGSLRRGWETGRIGNDLMPLHTEALDAEIAGDTARADAIRAQIDALQKRQQLYSPKVGRLEDIHGVGDAMDFAAGQVGQGVASMADPVAVSTGLNAVGRVASAIPHPLAQGVGKAAQLGAFIAPGLMSKRQLTGEFIGNAEQDPELMARTSPQALRDMAGTYGTLAAIPDSALPGLVGRQLTGASRTAGLMGRGMAMGPASKALLGMTGEGATEALQSEGSHQALGMLNPNRDTSGDAMDNLNNFAGGFLGSSPFAGAGAYAEAGHRRLGDGIDRVKDVAGTVVDMANENSVVQGAKSALGKAKDGVVDLMSGDDGKLSGAALVENLKAGAQDIKSAGQTALDEHNVLTGVPPLDILNDSAKAGKWLEENDVKRAQLIADKLQAMPDDEEAQKHLEALSNPDDTAYRAATEDAAKFLLSKTPVGRAEERAATLGENLGKIAGVVGPAIGKGAVATGKAAVKFGKSILSGAKDGMAKKNEQASPEGSESFMAWRDRVYGVNGEQVAEEALNKGASYAKAQEFGQRAELAGNYAADMASRSKANKGMVALARHAAFSIADMIDSMKGSTKSGRAGMDSAMPDLKSKTVRLDRLTSDFHDIYKSNAPEVLRQLGNIMGPGASPAVEHMLTTLEKLASPQGRQAQVSERDALARQVVGLIDPAKQNELMQQGVNLNTPRGREQALHLFEDFADGISSAPGARKALEHTFGEDSVASVMGLLNGVAEKKEKVSLGPVVDDRKQTSTGSSGEANLDDEELSDFDVRTAEKTVTKGSGPKVYGFHATANLRTNSERRDMFAATATGADGISKRPNLFTKGQQLFGGKGDAIAKKIADVKAQLAEDPEYPDHDNHSVTAKTAHEVMKDAGMQPGKILQLYRDYLFADGNIEETAQIGSLLKKMVQARTGTATSSIKERNERKARMHAWADANPGKTAEDYKEVMAAERTAALREPLAEAMQAAEAYFKDRYVVVGEQLSNRDPSKISVPELLDLHKEGAGLIERSRLTDEPMQTLSDANVLMFKSDAVKGGEVAIPAGKLVKWVREQRGKTEASSAEDTSGNYSNRTKNEEYLSDVSEGIASLIGSGKVQGMPYKLNKFGKVEHFGQGVPESLRLATQTYGEMKFGERKRREMRAYKPDSELATVGTEGYSEKVGADQDKNDEFFTADDRAERELVVDERRTKPRKKQSELRASDTGGELVTRKGNTDEFGDPWDEGRGTSTRIRVDVSGQTVADPKTDDPNATPLDFSKAQRDGVPDEFADQRWLSRQTGASTDRSIGPEPKGTAASSAGYRAQAITDAFGTDPTKGQEMIKMRIRMAMAPEFSEAGKDALGKAQVVGGVHYIAPVAAFINSANLAANNVDLSAASINAIRSKVAAILTKGVVSKTEKVKIARLMYGDEEKVTAMNVDALLGRTADGATTGKPIVAKTEAAGPSVESRMAKDNYEGLDTVAQVDAFLKSAHALWQNGVEDRDVQAKLNRMFDSGNYASTDLAGFYEGMKGGNAELDHDELLANLNKPAPEVANAGLPKGQQTLSGGVSLPVTSSYTPKDQAKSDMATKFIGRGSAASSTAKYAEAWGDRANSGNYTADDKVFVSAEGNRAGRVNPDAAEIQKAMDAGATIITDDAANRGRPYNVGERQVARQLAAGGYAEKSPGVWAPRALSGVLNAQDQAGPSKVASHDDMQEAKAYAKKVLGPQIKVEFKDITGYSGEFLDAQNVIEVSTTAAAGTMNTLYHEAMHVFFRDFVKGNPKMQAVFESLINDPKYLQKLHDLLDGFPAAQAQLHGAGSGEERLAYTYQFWKAGLLQVDTNAHTWLQKVGKFFRRVLGMVRDSERALELFQAFDQGKMSEPSAAGKVIAKALGAGTNAMKLRRQFDAMFQGLAALTVPSAEILARSVSPTARKLSTMMFTNPGEEAHGSEEIGMMNARRNVSQQYINVANRKFEAMSEVDKKAVQKYLQSGTDPKTIASKEQREAVADIRHLLDRFHKYMVDAGMDIGKVENYYPVVWNPNLLNAHKGEFISMLVNKYAQQMNPNGGNAHKSAERIWQSLVSKEGVDAHLPVGREDGVLSPFFASQEMRTLPWLDAADREKYLDKNMPLTLTRYFNQGAHAAEYHRRFGKNGIELEKMLLEVRKELSLAGKEKMKRGEIKDEPARVKWVARQMRDISQSVGAMEGTLGKDISPNMRKFNSWMAVYQNVRLLPMALFSSFVDPLAMVARGAPWQAAYETFVYSMREVFRGWADVFKDMPPERQKDEWRQLAEFIGASEIAMFQHHVSDEYSSTYMTPGAKKLNDKMFVFNGMEAWNRGNRIMATKWGVRFIEKHVTNADPVHSMRWLKELGLTPDMITMDDGKLVTSPQQLSVLKGISLDEARKQIAPIHDALNRFVEGAVLTPNAAQRPAWSSDPNWASMFHLKQFSYSFHQTILKRATNEFNHGNMAPLGALAMFIPTMIAADLMKGLIQGAGTLPPYMASMNAGDWLMHGSQRAGLSGIGVIGMDAATDWASLGGPAFEQIIDAGRDGFGSKSALNAMPLHALYGTLVNRGMDAVPA